jgi:hypothetical protein
MKGMVENAEFFPYTILLAAVFDDSLAKSTNLTGNAKF